MTPEQVASFNELLKAYDGETLFRPSSADRWLNCWGSIRLGSTVKRDSTSSVYALQGTAAHTVLNEALEERIQPDEWGTKQVEWNENGVDQKWTVDDEMVEAITFTANVVRERITPHTKINLEYKMSLQPLDPSYPLLGQNRGTADVALVDTKERILDIMDLKYGQGVMVPGDSPQLLDYALMGMINFEIEGGWSKIRSTIIQPRARDDDELVKTVEFEPEFLLGNFVGKLVGAMEAALEPDPPLRPDPTGKYCRWCPAKSVCPALQAAGMSVTMPHAAMVGAAIAATSPMPPIPKEMPALPDVALMGEKALATVLERRKVYDAWIEAVEERAFNMLQAGLDIPGWEIGQRTGNRKWVNPDEAATKLRTEFGVSLVDMYTPQTLRSPAQVEKMISKERKKDLESLVDRPQGGLYLKPASSKKPAKAPLMGAIKADNS